MNFSGNINNIMIGSIILIISAIIGYKFFLTHQIEETKDEPKIIIKEKAIYKITFLISPVYNNLST